MPKNSKLIIDVLSNLRERGIVGNNGNCGILALAMIDILREKRIQADFLVFTDYSDDQIEDRDDMEEMSDILLYMKAPLFHVCIQYQDDIYDIEGKIDRDYVINWINKEYSLKKDISTHAVSLNDENIFELIISNTDPQITADEMYKEVKNSFNNVQKEYNKNKQKKLSHTL